MNKIRIMQVGVFLLILFLAYFLRHQKYDQVPLPGDSFDEYSNSAVGLSLIRLGMPVGALGVGGYENLRYQYLNIEGIFNTGKYSSPIAVTWPWFDHPPLIGLITGGFAYMKGAETFEDLTLVVIRKPMLVLGVITTCLVIILGWLMYGYTVGLFAGLIYSSSPLVVVSSRMVQAENGYTPMFLLSLIFMVMYRKYKRMEFFYFSIFIAGVGLWFKLSAVAIFICIFLLLNFKERVCAIVFYLPFLMVFIVYGFVYNATTFLNVFLANTNRVYGIGMEALYELIVRTRITNTKFLTDPWILVGWMSVSSVFNEVKRNGVLVSAIVSILIVYLLQGNFPYGWYAIPLWPFIIISLGYYLVRSLQSGVGMLMAGMALLVPIGYMFSKIVNASQMADIEKYWRLGIVGLILLFGYLSIHSLANRHVLIKVSKFVIIALFIVAISCNVIYLSLLDTAYWYKIL